MNVIPHTGQEAGSLTNESVFFDVSSSTSLFIDSSIFVAESSCWDSPLWSSIDTSESDVISSCINSASFEISDASSSIDISEWSKFFVSS